MAEQAGYLKSLKSESVVQRVINCLTDAMVNKELKPGDKLPTEPELAAAFGVARTSVREATKILTYMGVLESRRAEGTFVTQGFQESMIDPMVYGIILNQGDDFNSLMELRQLTEVGILRLAIKRGILKGWKRFAAHWIILRMRWPGKKRVIWSRLPFRRTMPFTMRCRPCVRTPWWIRSIGWSMC